MKKLCIFTAAVLILALSGCGKDDGEHKSQIVDADGVRTVTSPISDEEIEALVTPFPETAEKTETSPEASHMPAKTGEANNKETAPDAPSEEAETVEEPDAVITAEQFEETDAAPSYMRYTSGDTKWGLVMPERAQIGDEDESGVLFMVDGAILVVQITDADIPSMNEEDIEAALGLAGDSVSGFTLIESGGEHVGCYLTRTTPEGNESYSKLVTNGSSAVTATVVSPGGELTDELKECVNSLVIFE